MRKFKKFGNAEVVEMCKCIGCRPDIRKSGRHFFTIRRNIIKITVPNEIWDTLRKCGYADRIATQINIVAGLAYDTFCLTQAGVDWLAKRIHVRLVTAGNVNVETLSMAMIFA